MKDINQQESKLMVVIKNSHLYQAHVNDMKF